MEDIKIYQDEYENLDKLGEGGNAKVHKARHKKLDYICAVRRLLVKGDKIAIENDDRYKKFIEECSELLRIGSG